MTALIRPTSGHVSLASASSLLTTARRFNSAAYRGGTRKFPSPKSPRVDGFEGLRVPDNVRNNETSWNSNPTNRQKTSAIAGSSAPADVNTRHRTNRESQLTSAERQANREAYLRNSFAMQEETFKRYHEQYAKADGNRAAAAAASPEQRGQAAYSAEATAAEDAAGRAAMSEGTKRGKNVDPETWSHMKKAAVAALVCMVIGMASDLPTLS